MVDPEVGVVVLLLFCCGLPAVSSGRFMFGGSSPGDPDGCLDQEVVGVECGCVVCGDVQDAAFPGL